MDLSGNLSVIEPSLVFQFLHTCSLTGLLKLVTLRRNGHFYFREGDIILAAVDSQKRIGEYLLERELLTWSQLDGALQAFRHEKGLARLGEILMERGYVGRESLAAALREQMQEAVYEVLDWKEGAFLFFRGVRPEASDIVLDVKMDHLILEGLRRMDECR